MSGDVAAEVAAVLAEHLPTWTNDGFVCRACGHVFVRGNPGSYSGFRDPDEVKALIRAHQAEALAPLIAERVAAADYEARLSEMQGKADSLTGQWIKAEAWDEGWAARAEYENRRDVPLDWPDRNPYRNGGSDA